MVRPVKGVSGRIWIVDERQQAAPGSTTPFLDHAPAAFPKKCVEQLSRTPFLSGPP